LGALDAKRQTIHHLDVAAVQTGLQQIDADIRLSGSPVARSPLPATVVFLCTGNSARSARPRRWTPTFGLVCAR
jgi:hypothetical protein